MACGKCPKGHQMTESKKGFCSCPVCGYERPKILFEKTDMNYNKSPQPPEK